MTAAHRNACSRRLGECVDAGQHDLAQRRRHRRATFVFGREQLLGEERVAVGAQVRAVDELDRRLAPNDARDQLAYLVAVEPFEIDPGRHAGTVELDQQRAQRMTTMKIVGAIRADEEQ